MWVSSIRGLVRRNYISVRLCTPKPPVLRLCILCTRGSSSALPRARVISQKLHVQISDLPFSSAFSPRQDRRVECWCSARPRHETPSAIIPVSGVSKPAPRRRRADRSMRFQCSALRVYRCGRFGAAYLGLAEGHQDDHGSEQSQVPYILVYVDHACRWFQVSRKEAFPILQSIYEECRGVLQRSCRWLEAPVPTKLGFLLAFTIGRGGVGRR